MQPSLPRDAHHRASDKGDSRSQIKLLKLSELATACATVLQSLRVLWSLWKTGEISISCCCQAREQKLVEGYFAGAYVGRRCRHNWGK